MNYSILSVSVLILSGSARMAAMGSSPLLYHQSPAPTGRPDSPWPSAIDPLELASALQMFHVDSDENNTQPAGDESEIDKLSTSVLPSPRVLSHSPVLLNHIEVLELEAYARMPVAAFVALGEKLFRLPLVPLFAVLIAAQRLEHCAALVLLGLLPTEGDIEQLLKGQLATRTTNFMHAVMKFVAERTCDLHTCAEAVYTIAPAIYECLKSLCDAVYETQKSNSLHK